MNVAQGLWCLCLQITTGWLTIIRDPIASVSRIFGVGIALAVFLIALGSLDSIREGLQGVWQQLSPSELARITLVGFMLLYVLGLALVPHRVPGVCDEQLHRYPIAGPSLFISHLVALIFQPDFLIFFLLFSPLVIGLPYLIEGSPGSMAALILVAFQIVGWRLAFALASQRDWTKGRLSRSTQTALTLVGLAVIVVVHGWIWQRFLDSPDGTLRLLWGGALILSLLASLGIGAFLNQHKRLMPEGMNYGSFPTIPGSHPCSAIIDKELRYLWRDPWTRIWLVQANILNVAAFALLAWLGSYIPPAHVSPLFYLFAIISGLTLGEMGLNSFGLERQGLTILFRSPMDRRLLLLAKSSAHLLTGMLQISLYLLSLAIILEVFYPIWKAWLLAFGLLLISLSVADWLSVFFPMKVWSGAALMGRTTLEAGLAFTIFSLLLSFPLWVVLVWKSMTWAAWAAPLWGGLIFGVTLFLLPHRLIAREHDILRACV